MKMNRSSLFLAFPAALLLSSCQQDDTDRSIRSRSGSEQHALASFLLAEPPQNAVSITEARKNPTPGTKVVVSGKIMGNSSPLIKSRALLTLGDPARMRSCDLIPGDECPTPWDVCCGDPDVIAASIATVQLVDTAGRPLKSGLRGLGGLRELSSLVVVGEVAEGSSEKNFLVNATGIHVAMAEPTTEDPTQP